MKYILLIIFCFSMSFAFGQIVNTPIPIEKGKEAVKKDSVIVQTITDSTALMAIRDCEAVMKVLETEPGYTKHDYDQVEKAFRFLIQTAIKRRNTTTNTK